MIPSSPTMETSPDINESMIDEALHYLHLGYRPIPLPPGSKGTGMRFRWKRYQTETPTERDLMEWFSAGEHNIALVTGQVEVGQGVVVVDVDDPALLDAVLEHCGDTPMQCRTPSGGTHCYYRMRDGVRYGNAVRIKDRPLDLRCEGAYAVCPWSRNDEGVAYRWAGDVLGVSELPHLKVSWLRERKLRRRLLSIEPSLNTDAMVRRARAYLAHIEGSISGCRGHDRAMRAAGVLCQKFGLSLEQALPLFMEWSESSCEPPWSEKEAIHKLQDAIRLRSQRGLRPIE